MRTFIRLAPTSGYVMTLDVPPATTIAEIRRIIVDSGQYKLPLERLVLTQGATVLDDAWPIDRCVDLTPRPPSLYTRVHMVAWERAPTTVGDPSAPPPALAAALAQPQLPQLLQPGQPVRLQLHAPRAWTLEVHDAWTDTAVVGSSKVVEAAAAAGTGAVLEWRAQGYIRPGSWALLHLRCNGNGDGDGDGDAADWLWTAEVAQPRGRLPLRVVSVASGVIKLVNVQRDSPAPTPELVAHICASFQLSPDDIGLLEICNGNSDDSDDNDDVHGTWRPLVDADVAVVPVGTTVRFSHACAQPTSDRNEPPPPALLSHAEYVQQHWVNPESGYYAIGGKLSAEEELEVCLALIRAYDSEAAALDSSGPPTVAVPSPADLLFADADRSQRAAYAFVASVPRAPALLRLLPLDTVATVSSTAPASWPEAAVLAFVRDGFVAVHVDAATVEAAASLYDAQAALWAAGGGRALATADPNTGYRHSTQFHKQMVVVRRQLLPSMPPKLAMSVVALAARLWALSRGLLAAALALLERESGRPRGSQPLSADALLEDTWTLNRSNAKADAAQATTSLSNMSLIDYDPADNSSSSSSGKAGGQTQAPAPPSPPHTDVGVITAIPCGRFLLDGGTVHQSGPLVGSAGLQVFHGGDGVWQSVDACGAATVLFMAGEALRWCTDIPPCIHAVAASPSRRLSAPLQLLPRADAVLTRSGPGLAIAAVRGDDFVHAVSSNRQPSNR